MGTARVQKTHEVAAAERRNVRHQRSPLSRAEPEADDDEGRR